MRQSWEGEDYGEMLIIGTYLPNLRQVDLLIYLLN